MSITISVASGVTHTYMLTFIFMLMAMTMYCGYVTEVLSPPEDAGDDVRPKQWVVCSGNPDQLLPFIPAFIQRLGPHLIGYFPYLAVWAVLGHSFFFNVGDAEQGPPSFVYIIGTRTFDTAIHVSLCSNHFVRVRSGGPVRGLFLVWNHTVCQPGRAQRALVVLLGGIQLPRTLAVFEGAPR